MGQGLTPRRRQGAQHTRVAPLGVGGTFVMLGAQLSVPVIVKMSPTDAYVPRLSAPHRRA